MRRLLCKIFGHKWRGRLIECVFSMWAYKCERCGKIGLMPKGAPLPHFLIDAVEVLND